MEDAYIYNNLPTLETDRLILRKITMDDLEDMFKYGSDEEVSKYVTWDTHQTLSDTKEFIDFVLGKYEAGEVAPWGIELKENNRFIGTVDFVSWSTKHQNAEIGYVLAREYWGKGIVTEAAYALLKFGFEKMDLERIQARCLIENIGSARVMEKIGMSFEGVMRKGLSAKGKLHNLKVYSILKEEFVIPVDQKCKEQMI